MSGISKQSVGNKSLITTKEYKLTMQCWNFIIIVNR